VPDPACISYPTDARGIIDVTKAPYFADNTGARDCTAILIRILDEILQPSMDGMREVMAILEVEPSENRVLPNSFENRKQDGKLFGVFPIDGPTAKIIYFPKGVYLVSDTICYSFDDLRNGLGAELNWCIRFQGENEQECVIKLKDQSKGFEYGMSRPMISFIRGPSSNIAMSNFMRDMTIDIGAGNPGAIGVEFMGNNCAGMRNVTIRTTDPQARGQAGLSMSRKGISGCVFKQVTIEGFDEAISMSSLRAYVVFDHLRLIHQARRGLVVKGDGVVCIRGLRSTSRFPALSLAASDAHVVLIEAELDGGMADAPAVELQTGHLFLRGIQTQGYRCALGRVYSEGWGTDPLISGSAVDEYVSDPISTLNKQESQCSLNLPITEAPVPDWDLDFDNWTHPGVFGAVGDGVTDDTAAIQSTMDSGKPVIYFQPGHYRINAPIRIPGSVRHVNFMFVDLAAGERLQHLKNQGMFAVTGESEEPLLMEDLFCFERNYGHHYLFEQAAKRTLIVRNVHAQSCAAYINSVPGGTVFLENIVTTTGILNDTYQHPCFVFRGQTAWCWQLDPEYTPDKIINDGSTLFIIGFKTEGEGIAFTAKNHAQMEVLGGVLYFGANDDTPVVLNEDSDVAFIASTVGTTSQHVFKVTIREVAGGKSQEIHHDKFPTRLRDQYTIPLYVGRRR